MIRERTSRNSNLDDFGQIYSSNTSSIKKLQQVAENRDENKHNRRSNLLKVAAPHSNDRAKMTAAAATGGVARRDEHALAAGQNKNRRARAGPTASEQRQIQKLFHRKSVMKRDMEAHKRDKTGLQNSSGGELALMNEIARVSEIRAQI